MRLYISADIEGMGPVVSREQTRPGGFEYEAARDWMTRSIIAVCETARDRGVREIVVSDSHGNGQNLYPDAFPDYVELVRSWPRPLGMMQGIERGRFDGAFLVGYHGAGSNPHGVLSHTLSSEFFQEVRLNGAEASEATISAAIAGAFDVPILMVAGDDAATEEMREALGDVASATLKHAYGSYSAVSPTPRVAEERLRAATIEGLSKAGRIAPLNLGGPIELQIRLRTRFVAEWLSYLEGIERIDAYTIRHVTPDVIALSKFLMFLISARMATAP